MSTKEWGRVRTICFLLTIAYFLRVYLYVWVGKYFVSYFQLDKIKSTADNDFVGFLLILSFCWFINSHFWRNRRLVPSTSTMVSVGLFALWYILVFRSAGPFLLTRFRFVSWLRYSDAVLLICFIPFLKFRYLPLPADVPDDYAFIEDNFKIGSTPDLLGRKKYAVQIARGILSSPALDKSFVIAINSPWGFGKTAFLSMIEGCFKIPDSAPSDALEKDLSIRYRSSIRNSITVVYNPWRNLDEKSVITDFLEELRKEFSPYHPDIAGLLQRYSKYLGKLDNSKFTELVRTSIESANLPGSVTSLFDEINDRIQQIGKRVVVFVDDLDRLNGAELIDVLKMIRNTANFRNTFFLVAYDHNYVLNTIDKSDLISNKEEFLQKIVQLEITLPTFPKGLPLEYFRQEIKKVPALKDDYERISDAIVRFSSITMPAPPGDVSLAPGAKPEGEISAQELLALFGREKGSLLAHSILRNIRDVVRLLNSFKITYSAIGRVGDPYEILLLEILKTKYLSIYQLLSDRQIIRMGEKDRYVIDQAAFQSCTNIAACPVLNIRHSEVQFIEKCLSAIFSAERQPFFRSVTYPQYFGLYFAFEAPGAAELDEIESNLKNDARTFPAFLQNVTDDQRHDIESYLYSIKDFSSPEGYRSAVAGLFYLANYNNRVAVSHLSTLLNDKQLVRRLFPGDGLSTFVEKLLTDPEILPELRAEFAFTELYKIVNVDDQGNVDQIVPDKAFLQKVMCFCLNELIKRSGYFDSESYNLYVRNIDTIEPRTRRIRITPCANSAARAVIADEPYRYLTELFIRVHPEPTYEGKFFHFDPFIDQYFGGDVDAVRKYLTDQLYLQEFSKEEKETYNKILRRFDEQPYPRPDKFFVDNKGEISEYIAFIKQPN